MPPRQLATINQDIEYRQVIQSIHDCLSKLNPESMGTVYGMQAEISNLKANLQSMLVNITQCQDSIVALKVELSATKASVDALNQNFVQISNNKSETQKLNASGKWGVITSVITGILAFITALVIAYFSNKK